jgi:hypothetical protein
MNIKKKSAFTIIEAATVFVIIGAIVAISISSVNLVGTSKISSARVLTANSPVKFTDGVVLWLETLSDEGFENNENQDGSVVSSWKNIQPDGFDITLTSSGSNRPIYIRDGINNLPSIRFDGGDDYIASASSSLMSGLTDYSTFVVYQPNTSTSDDYGRMWTWGANANNTRTGPAIGGTGFGSKNGIAVQANTGSSDTVVISDNLHNTGKAYIVSYIFDGSQATDADKLKIFHNGSQVATSVANPSIAAIVPSDSQPFQVGGEGALYNYGGDIGEIIIIRDAISEKRRQEINNYLAKKWGIK